MKSKLSVKKAITVIAIFLIIIIVGTVCFFRTSPQFKLLRIALLGDKNLYRVMDHYKAKFIPEQYISYCAGSITDNISIAWAFRPEYSVGFYPIPVVDDTDHDGKPEVYVGSYSRCIYSLDGATGKTIWKWKLPFGVVGGRVVNLVDLNNDGKKELILGTHTTLPIRVYALKTGKTEDDRVLWKTNLAGDFLEGGLSVVNLKGKNPLIIAATRDAPYSRGSLNVLKSDGSFLFPSISGVDDCISRPGIGLLPVSKNLALIHGSHNFYKATFANEIVARDLNSGKILWTSPKIGDTGFQNHQLIDIDFDGKNEVLAFAFDRSGRKEHKYILNGLNGSIIKQVLWNVQGMLKSEKRLIVSEGDKTMCLSKTGDILYTIPKISFGIKQSDSQIFLFGVTYVNNTLIIKQYNALNGQLVKNYSCSISVPYNKNISDYGSVGPPENAALFLTLADTDNDGNWNCLMQIKDFVVSVNLPVKVAHGVNPFAPLPFRNIDNGGVIY